MNRKFDIFMRAVDDDILDEAQLYIPRKQGLFKAACLAACLCIIVGAYYITFGGMGAKSEECLATDLLYNETMTAPPSTTAAAAQAESATEATDNESGSGVPAPPLSESRTSPLPANAVVCNFTVTEDSQQIDFSVGDMDFSFTADLNDMDDSVPLNVLLSDAEEETITWYSEDGSTEYTLELIDGDYDLLYSTAQEIAENLGIEIE